MAALVKCRWVDDDLTIHDWEENGGRMVRKRASDAARKRKDRQRSEASVQRTSVGHPADIQRTAQNVRAIGEEHKESKESKRSSTDADDPVDNSPDLFDEFWDAYPRKVKKKAAGIAFAQLSATDQSRAILAANNRAWYDRDASTPKDKIPHPTTFLHKGVWEDWVDGWADGYTTEGKQHTDSSTAQPISWQTVRPCASCGTDTRNDPDAEPVAGPDDSVDWYCGRCWGERKSA